MPCRQAFACLACRVSLHVCSCYPAACAVNVFCRPVVTVSTLLQLLTRLQEAADDELFPSDPSFGMVVASALRTGYRLLPKEASALLAEAFTVLLNQLMDASVDSFFGATTVAESGAMLCASITMLSTW